MKGTAQLFKRLLELLDGACESIESSFSSQFSTMDGKSACIKAPRFIRWAIFFSNSENCCSPRFQKCFAYILELKSITDNYSSVLFLVSFDYYSCLTLNHLMSNHTYVELVNVYCWRACCLKLMTLSGVSFAVELQFVVLVGLPYTQNGFVCEWLFA